MGLEKLICPHCYNSLQRVQKPVCLKCGSHISNPLREYCSDCEKRKKSFEKNLALFEYSDPAADRMIWNLKYKNKREFADFLAAEIAVCFGREILSWKCDAVIPVPVHPIRRMKRGYNQAECIAKRLGELLELKTDSKSLKRVKKTRALKRLTAQGRAESLKDAFSAASLKKYKAVLLVDDIYTTGGTLEGCTKALKKAGVEKVYCVTCCIGNDNA